MSFLYAGFGLRIESDLPIPGLEPLPALPPVDLNIWQEVRPEWIRQLPAPEGPPWRAGLTRDENGEPIIRVWRFTRGEGKFIRVCYRSGNEFLIDQEARDIWVLTREPRSPEHIALFLLGPILTFVLRLRGVVCLHASAVVVDGKAIVLVGERGAGKSTLAAAFARAGYLVLADDNVPLLIAGEGFTVLPAYPRVRLWAEAAAGLYGPAADLPHLAPDLPKGYLDLARDGHFQRKPTALDAIYRLGARVENSDIISIQNLSAREALIILAENTFGSLILDYDQRAAEFQFLGELAARVPLLRLVAPDDLAGLDSVVDALARNVRSRAATEG